MQQQTLTADDLNAALRMPPDTWALDFHRSHVIAAGLGPDRALAATQAISGPAFTLIHRGRVAALWGLVIPWTGLAEGWLITIPDVVRPIAAPFTYGARAFCDLAADRLGLRRIQVHVQITNGAFLAWARAARFRAEAQLDCYTAEGEDVILMARTWRR